MARYFAVSDGRVATVDRAPLRDRNRGPAPGLPFHEPTLLQLIHQIGWGRYGEVWLAEYRYKMPGDERCKVVVKLLRYDNRALMHKLYQNFSKIRRLQRIGLVRGFVRKEGKLGFVMEMYKGSVLDVMGFLPLGRLSFYDALRYGIDVAEGVLGLHSIGLLNLNLKPSNFLLNRDNRIVLGDMGIPYFLLGEPMPSFVNDLSRPGTPNYRAPEQWEPGVRGPVSFETDSWGFACSMVEMLTGCRPWHGMCEDVIYDVVVKKQQKPRLFIRLPPQIENILLGCFENDFRRRPLMGHILPVFRSTINGLLFGEDWLALGGRELSNRSNRRDTDWFLSKNEILIGDTVRSRKLPNSCKPERKDIPEGKVVEKKMEKELFVFVQVPGIHGAIRVHVPSVERVSYGLAVGDWVRMEGENQRSCVGIVHVVNRSNGDAAVGFVGLKTLWAGNSSELQMAESYCVGQFVRLKANVRKPRFEWMHKTGGVWPAGRISRVLPNGCLVVKFPNRKISGEVDRTYLADPAEVELVSFGTCRGLVNKYRHLEDIHWSVRPLLIDLVLFTAMKIVQLVGRQMQRQTRSGDGDM